MQGTPEERFWAKVAVAGPDDCWLWTAGTQSDGYGTFGVRPKTVVLAHRYAYELQNGPIPPGLCVLHSCDVRRCQNGRHLFAGTNAQNHADMVRKGRQNHRTGPRNPRRGERHPRSRLTAELVRECRARNAAGESVRSLAAAKGVAYRTLFAAVKGASWRHA